MMEYAIKFGMQHIPRQLIKHIKLNRRKYSKLCFDAYIHAQEEYIVKNSNLLFTM